MNKGFGKKTVEIRKVLFIILVVVYVRQKIGDGFHITSAIRVPKVQNYAIVADSISHTN